MKDDSLMAIPSPTPRELLPESEWSRIWSEELAELCAYTEHKEDERALIALNHFLWHEVKPGLPSPILTPEQWLQLIQTSRTFLSRQFASIAKAVKTDCRRAKQHCPMGRLSYIRQGCQLAG